MSAARQSPAWEELQPGWIRARADRAGAGGAPSLERVRRAADAIAPYVITTPVRALQGRPGVVAKLECLQRTGSFKVRGAASRLLAMGERDRRAGVVAASSGNHGLAVASLATELGVPAVVCVPRTADTVKLEAIRRAGAEVHADSDSYDDAERRAFELAAERGLSFVHPFDDADVISGQATVGLELSEQIPDLGAVLMPMSGGGLAVGMAVALRALVPRIRLIGVSVETAPVLYRSLLAGHAVQVGSESALAGALSGGLSDTNSYTLPLANALLDEAWLVSEREIASAMLSSRAELHTAVEGAGAAAIAALSLPQAASLAKTGTVAVIVSGGNVDAATLDLAKRLAATRPPSHGSDDADRHDGP